MSLRNPSPSKYQLGRNAYNFSKYEPEYRFFCWENLGDLKKILRTQGNDRVRAVGHYFIPHILPCPVTDSG